MLEQDARTGTLRATYTRSKAVELGAIAVRSRETPTTDGTAVRTAEGAAATAVGAGIDIIVEGVDGDHGHDGQA